MSLFHQIHAAILGGAKKEFVGPIPGAMGKLLHDMGIDEIGPHVHRGIPASVLGGCKPQVVKIPKAFQPAYTQEGKPIMIQRKGGRKPVQAMDQFGVSRQVWKMMVNDQKRKHTGRWYSGEPADVREDRLKKSRRA